MNPPKRAVHDSTMTVMSWTRQAGKLKPAIRIGGPSADPEQKAFGASSIWVSGFEFTPNRFVIRGRSRSTRPGKNRRSSLTALSERLTR